MRARALVTGEVIGQVASQTLDNMAVISSATALPVLRPLVGMDKEEITTEAQRLGTFSTSIVPDEDCCTLFTPRHPVTRARWRDVGRDRTIPADRRDGRGCHGRCRARAIPLPGAGRRCATCRAVSSLGTLGLFVCDTLAGERCPVASVSGTGIGKIEEILGEDAALLHYQCKTIPRDSLHLPGPDFVERLYRADRSEPAGAGRTAVDARHRPSRRHRLRLDPAGRPGHRAFRRRVVRAEPAYFDPENIVKLAIEGGCNAVASTLGVLGSVARRYAHKIPFILKFNHNEFLSYPNTYDQIRFASVKQAFDMGAQAVGATIYFGSDESKRQLQEVSEMFQQAHELGMFTVLWCYTRNAAFKTQEVDYHLSADLTGQANHLGVTIGADIIKQKMPETNGGYNALKFGKTHKAVYSQLTSDNPIDLTRYQLANCYMGRIRPDQLRRRVGG